MNTALTLGPASTRLSMDQTPAPPVAGPGLLTGWYETGAPADLVEHHRRYGRLPIAGRPGRPARLIDEVTAAGLRGRGGAGFPTARKLAAVAAAGRRPVVVANGCEGEPASAKDAALLSVAPHLVLDGSVLAAHALGALEVILCIHQGAAAARTLPSVIAERHDPVPVRLVEVPARYVASEASALVHFLNCGDARPTTSPPRASQQGVNGRPTLVDNVETLAHLALIARFGASWFRSTGTPQLPGTLLITLGGAIRRPGVYELAGGTTLGTALQHAGGPTTPVQAVLTGGYAGNWLTVPKSLDVPLCQEGPPTTGSALGVAVLLALPRTACGLAQTAHLLRYLAAQSTKQCGPCTFGLPAIATDLTDLVAGHPSAPAALERLHRRLGVIPGRGACAHPDGAARLTTSALQTFATDLHHHIHGYPCPAAGDPPLFPIPGRH
ncbi:MAG TPA: NADH-ubiquinone oxidoreductase-F iron-sulfur binding region domain-containing protein [Pseudonocardiaceae bacterium]|nr:NADH-ubiquinone oxidoreductase-F iron-sulfur binding region domain-containing protein [Pseudonocardiaceae bacterium]